MKKSLIIAIVLSAFVGVGGSAANRRSQAGPHQAEFQAFYADFLKAVRANDKEKIADLISFPVDDWSTDIRHNVQTIKIKDRAEFLKKYDILFTSSMRLHAAKAKPEPLKDGRYVMIWKETDVECSFEIGYIDGTGYRVTSYSIGPL